MDKIKKQLEFLIEIDKLKEIFRQSILVNSRRNENDAEHSWHLCMYAVVLSEYAPKELNIARVLKMLLIHDVVEIYAGDTYLYDAEANKTKAVREQAAADKIYSLLPTEQGNELKELWYEFERCDTIESKYANSLDRLQPVILNYMSQGERWLEHKVHKADVIERGYRLMNYAPQEIKEVFLKILDDSVEKGYLLP